MARLTNITTKSGDTGETGLVGGQRIAKDHPRIEAIGTVDELNSVLGLARALGGTDAALRDRDLDAVLEPVQHHLFQLGAELATPPAAAEPAPPRVTAPDVAELERHAERLNRELGPLAEFILPGGCPAGAALHLARTVCRRAERQCVGLGRIQPLGSQVLPYLNRLGDLLFVLARHVNRQSHRREQLWEKKK